MGNGQIAVTCCDREPQATWPAAVRWSQPKTWAYDPQRRQPTRVPEEIPLRTTPEMALLRLAQARAWAGPHRGVVAGLEARQSPSVVAGRTDFAVRLRHGATSRLWRADEGLQTVPRWQWRTMRWRQGPTGGWRQQVVAVRCWRVTSAG